MSVARHLTALKRKELSRPVRLAIQDSILTAGSSLLDYGCGQGDDVRFLTEKQFDAAGWDPFFSQSNDLSPADIVNLGYVVNVVEDPDERQEVLKRAWSLSRRALIVSARLIADHDKEDVDFTDGYLTRRGTFQKLFNQNELRLWIDSTLNETSVAAASGVFYVFRDATLRYEYLSARVRRVSTIPRQRLSDKLFEQHHPLVERLMNFFSKRGRLPDSSELSTAAEIVEAFGSIRRAFMVIKRVTDTVHWERIRTERAQDLLVYMALARFSKRPKFSTLPHSLQLDIRSFFSSYSHASKLADALLFPVGDQGVIEKACRTSSVGKLTPKGLYLHCSALESLNSVLRVYEGCARALTGAVAGANVIKLHMHEPLVSYLCYPTFDTEAHPSLNASLVAHLRTLELARRDYSESENPPILHRKEELLSLDDERREAYHKLTLEEEQRGLYEEPSEIGFRLGWENMLKQKGLRISGHQVFCHDSPEMNVDL